MLAKTYTCALMGIDGYPVEVEVDITSSLPSFDLIGLPDPSVREARDRVRSAIKNCGLEFPLKRITVNLAPADLKKEGSSYDLAIAVGILIATDQVPAGDNISNLFFAGELSLDGKVRKIPGALAMASSLGKPAFGNHVKLFVPRENAAEASLIENIEVRGVDTLKQLVSFLKGEGTIPQYHPDWTSFYREVDLQEDMNDIKGQGNAKRALEISAAGNHNLLFYGPPGTGKTMLARRLPSIMPQLSTEEMLDITRIYSVAGKLSPSCPLVTRRPFCAPHHSASVAGIIGGGRIPQPGEVTLAHLGVLFLDELPEYKREVLEALRQPVEDQRVTVTRSAATLQYPAAFTFVASMNPCPCGNYGDPRHHCRCSHYQIQKYHSKLSGPLLDRIDLQVEVPRLDYSELEMDNSKIEASQVVRERVEKTRAVQKNRFYRTSNLTNGGMSSKQLKKYCILTKEAKQLAKDAFTRLGLSMRGYDRILKVARTIADLDRSEEIEAVHLAEAIQYRRLDGFIEGTTR